jgi:adenine C2-methylase RlmN of 23S rRNA A2503 and tRNA A37
MELVKQRKFANGIVYLLRTWDGYPIETTDTFLPSYTKHAIGRHQNALSSESLGSRSARWMIGVSVMSGCPVRCKFCATGQMRRYRNLSADEIVQQVDFVLSRHPELDPPKSFEFKINYTRMGEPFLNIEAVKEAIDRITARFPNTHHYISTIGVEGADYSWIKGKRTLQISLHSLDDARRSDLIPFKRKLSIEELGKIRVKSDLKTTLNLTLVDERDFEIGKLQKFFPADAFFVKLSPINPNPISEKNNLGEGIIQQQNLV